MDEVIAMQPQFVQWTPVCFLVECKESKEPLGEGNRGAERKKNASSSSSSSG